MVNNSLIGKVGGGGRERDAELQVKQKENRFEILEKYKTPEEYFKAFDKSKPNPCNPLLRYMAVVGGECCTVLNLLTTALDLIKKKKAGNQSIIIDDMMISQVLQEVEQQVSDLAKHIKQGYWGYDWQPLIEMRGVLSSIGRLVLLKILRVPLDYVPEEFDLIEKDLIALTNIHNQHIELRKVFYERSKRMPFEQAVEILKHNPLAGGSGASNIRPAESEIIEIKPGWFGISINLKEVWRRMRKKFRS